MKIGFNVRVSALGHEMCTAAHVVSVALRAALIFGNIELGDLEGLKKYTMDRVFAFVNAFAPLTNEVVS